MTSPVDVRATLRRTSLSSADGAIWTVAPLGASPHGEAADTSALPATVPGEVHADLLAGGRIADPFDGANEAAVGWVSHTDWVYRGTFEWAGGAERRHELVAEGLDTVATLTLNGEEIGRTANQHRSYRFDVTDRLRVGSNELEISFEAPAPAAELRAAELGDRPRAFPQHPYNAIRKMAASYGWDWGPDLAGAGIWRSIALESWSEVRLAAVRPLATLAGTTGELVVELELEWLDDGAGPAEIEVSVAGGTAAVLVEPQSPRGTVRVEVPDVAAWWPRGYGDPQLYEVGVELRRDGVRLDSFATRVGFRTVELSTAPDEEGSEFVLSVNGQPVYVRGFNWAPADALMTRLTPETYRRRLQDAAEAGANLIRVWGGGIYESEDFYSGCDELGLLVWQDFLFACAAYSEDEPLYGEVAAEAREAISRLARHPSLAVWNGNNENTWGFVEWGWRSRLAGRSWGDGYYTDLLPRLVGELDPRAVYVPGSPHSFAPYHHPNDPRHGTHHSWEVWNRLDYRHYRDFPARFVSEFGFQGPPAWSTLTAVVHDDPLDPEGPQMLIHQKAIEGNQKLERGLGHHLPRWSSEPVVAMDDWHWTTSLNQARAVAYGVEHFRSWFPRNRGVVVWQLNDNWPVVSWSAVDYAGIRKPLWYALRRTFADRLITLQPRPREDGDGEAWVLVAHNDSPTPWSGEFRVTRRSTGAGSDLLAEQRVAFGLDPRTAATFPLDPGVAIPEDERREFLAVSAPDAGSAYGYFVEDTALAVEPPERAYAVSREQTADGMTVTLTATALVKDAMLFPDRLDPAARVDSGLVTLLAGESHTFMVTGTDLDDSAVGRAPVLRTVNDLIGRA